MAIGAPLSQRCLQAMAMAVQSHLMRPSRCDNMSDYVAQCLTSPMTHMSLLPWLRESRWRLYWAADSSCDRCARLTLAKKSFAPPSMANGRTRTHAQAVRPQAGSCSRWFDAQALQCMSFSVCPPLPTSFTLQGRHGPQGQRRCLSQHQSETATPRARDACRRSQDAWPCYPSSQATRQTAAGELPAFS